MPSTKIDLVCSNLILRVRITCLIKHKRNVLLFVTVPMGSYKTFKRCYIPLVQFYVEHSSFLAVPFRRIRVSTDLSILITSWAGQNPSKMWRTTSRSKTQPLKRCTGSICQRSHCTYLIGFRMDCGPGECLSKCWDNRCTIRCIIQKADR